MSQQDCIDTIAPRRPWALAWLAQRGLGQACRWAAEIWLVWSDRSRQRRQLSELSDHMLRDIGLTRADAWAEADKPFWLP